jgi:putative toxin-antitoxin system antitoxin component (TIGR02293 family)
MSNPGKSRQAVPRAAGIKTFRGTGDSATKTAISIDSLAAFNRSPTERIAMIRQGIPAAMVSSLSIRMGLSKETLLTSLGLSRATIRRKERQATVLSPDESERVLGVEALIGQVQKMVNESGDPVGFDAARWVGHWITGPVPALGGETPASYMDTFEGQKLVANLLAMSQSGAYA